MTTPLIAPPARVWDKIEKVLDEQDRQRLQVEKMTTNTFAGAISRRKKISNALVTRLNLISRFVKSSFKLS